MRNSPPFRWAASTAGQCSWMMLTTCLASASSAARFSSAVGLEVRKKGHTFTPRLPRGAGQWAVDGAKVTWYSWPVGGPEDLLEDFVQAVHQSGMGAKVCLQLQRCQLHRGRPFAQAVAPGAFEELYLGLAKHVDRLHGIADQEAGASTRGLPPARNQGEAARTGCATYPETRPPADEAIVRRHRLPIRSTRPRRRARPAARRDLVRQSPPRHARRKPGAARRPHSAG